MGMIHWKLADLRPFYTSVSFRRNHAFAPHIGAFDIETTDWGDFASMYIWQFAIDDLVVFGRTWDDLRGWIQRLKAELGLSIDHRLVVYDQLLRYEVQFFKHYLLIDNKDLIARSDRDVLKCLVHGCLEMRDSYVYTEMSLDAMGEEIGVEKLRGYDYERKRHHLTELTPREMEYCEHDVLILTRYFRREAEYYGGVHTIPLTATQRVKRIISSEMYAECGRSRDLKYRMMYRQLKETPEDQAVLQMLRVAYFGGFNFASHLNANRVIDGVFSADLDACYGSMMFCKHFPMDRFSPLPIPHDKAALDRLIKGEGDYRGKAMLIHFEAWNIKARIPAAAFLPLYQKNYIARKMETRGSMKNTRLIECEHLETVLTDVDFRLMWRFYQFYDTPEQRGGIRIKAVLGSRYAPLPGYIINSIYGTYSQKKMEKAELKRIKASGQKPTPEQNAQYMRSKTNVSRIYGVFVQDPVRKKYEWDEQASCFKSPGYDSTQKQYNAVLYQWGVWVSSWARWELLKMFTQIALIGGKYNRCVLYCDTDCIKWTKYGAEAMQYISAYNDRQHELVKRLCRERGLDPALVEGLGEWDVEYYQHFKEIGVKQYCYIQDGEFYLKCSGLIPPDPHQDEETGEIINDGMCFFDKFQTAREKMDAFSDTMAIPEEDTKMLRRYYVDSRHEEDVVDYQGKPAHVSSESSILLKPRAFTVRETLKDLIHALSEDQLQDYVTKNFTPKA